MSNPRLKFIHQNFIDPRAQSEDLGDNAMRAGYYGIKNLKRILPELPMWVNKAGENFDKLDKIYDEVVTQYQRYMGHVLMNIGGIYTDMKTTDQPGVVYAVVPYRTQKEAMTFLRKNLFETPTWLLNKKILDLTSAPSSDQISSVQDFLLGSMLSTSRLQRLISAANREKGTYSIDEYLNDLKDGIWSELKTKKPIDNYRRNLQKSYVDRLSNMVNLAPPSSSSTGITIFFGPVNEPRKSDIISVAKASLRSLKDEINRSLPGYTDNMSRYHLEDVRERIEKALRIDD